nr:immunoglobulin heavy chain junction region [Mus musculus]NSM07423.1 immunoglobulin heavy chain junction region [Mus musculus]NSM08681.1 immunoglobulin heavy chain junction region [Mus musculus]
CARLLLSGFDYW